jgi:uncharacterized protein (TIGR01777 family)
MSGKSGFIGKNLQEYFNKGGHEVTGISRYDFKQGSAHISSLLENKDVLINLAGAPIIKRWTRKYCRELWNSRIETTKSLVEALSITNEKPEIFISSSAIGIYNDRNVHTEESDDYDNEFLGTLTRRWEEEAMRARLFANTFIIRTGIVLGNNGGALPKMSLPFKLGVGGKIASGKQMISWIHITDFQRAIEWIITNRPEDKIFNMTAPNPANNAEFSKTLGNVLNRPSIIPVPAFALRLLYGQGADTLISGQNVLPENLQKNGFTFHYPTLEPALKDLL